jgi:hypothetical protein
MSGTIHTAENQHILDTIRADAAAAAGMFFLCTPNAVYPVLGVHGKMTKDFSSDILKPVFKRRLCMKK